MLYDYCDNFFGPFHPKKWRSKNGFPIVFSESDLGGGGQFFRQHFFLKKPNTPEYAQVLVVTWAKPNSVTALLSPHPTSEQFSFKKYNF